MSQTTTHPLTGQVVHTEWVSNDVAASRAFFTAVFGTEFQDMSNPQGEYWTFGNQDLGVGGAIRSLMDEDQGHTYSAPYLAVEDLDAAIAAAEAAGATIMVPKVPVPGMGWFSWFKAPGDIIVAAWQNDPEAPAPPATP